MEVAFWIFQKDQTEKISPSQYIYLSNRLVQLTAGLTWNPSQVEPGMVLRSDILLIF